MDNDSNKILKEYFSCQDTFDVADIFRYYREKNPDILQTTVNWRIHNLVQSGIIKTIKQQ